MTLLLQEDIHYPDLEENQRMNLTLWFHFFILFMHIKYISKYVEVTNNTRDSTDQIKWFRTSSKAHFTGKIWPK